MLTELSVAPASTPGSVASGKIAPIERVLEHRWAIATATALIVIFSQVGIPMDPMALLVFGFGLLLIDGLTTKGLAQTKRVAIDWGPLFAVLLVYDLTHGIADTAGMPLQIDALIRADEIMFLGEVPTVWLQERMLGTEVAWWEVILTIIYCSHFFASPLLLLYLYKRSRARWLAYTRRFLTLNGLGMLTYILVPAAPPWWASERGHIPEEVGRVLGRGWSVIGLETAGGLMMTGQGGVNQVAALPSLHTGYSVLLAMVLWPTARRCRPILAGYPVAMGFTLVYGGEHYVIDIVFGALYAWGVMALWRAIDRRRSERAIDEPVLVPS